MDYPKEDYPIYEFKCGHIIPNREVLRYLRYNGRTYARPLCPICQHPEARYVQKFFLCQHPGCDEEFSTEGLSNSIKYCPPHRQPIYTPRPKPPQTKPAPTGELIKIEFKRLRYPDRSPCLQGCSVWGMYGNADKSECDDCQARIAYVTAVEDPHITCRGGA